MALPTLEAFDAAVQPAALPSLAEFDAAVKQREPALPSLAEFDAKVLKPKADELIQQEAAKFAQQARAAGPDGYASFPDAYGAAKKNFQKQFPDLDWSEQAADFKKHADSAGAALEFEARAGKAAMAVAEFDKHHLTRFDLNPSEHNAEPEARQRVQGEKFARKEEWKQKFGFDPWTAAPEKMDQKRAELLQQGADDAFAEIKKQNPKADKAAFDAEFKKMAAEGKSAAELGYLFKRFKEEGGDSAEQRAAKMLPFASRAANDVRGIALAEDRIAKGQGTEEDRIKVARSRAQGELDAERSLPGKALRQAEGLVPFVLEMATTAGAYTAAKGAVGAGVAGLAGTGRVAGAAGSVLGGAAGLGAQALANPQMIAEETSKYMANKYALSKDESGAMQLELAEAGDSLGKALAKGFGKTALEIGSEKLGEFLGPSMAALWRKMPTKLQDRAAKLGIMKLIGDGKVKENAVKEFFRKGGIQGPISESMEERFNDLIAGATGLEKDYGAFEIFSSDPEKRAQAREGLAVEGLLFAAMGMAQHSPDVARAATAALQKKYAAKPGQTGLNRTEPDPVQSQQALDETAIQARPSAAPLDQTRANQPPPLEKTTAPGTPSPQQQEMMALAERLKAGDKGAEAELLGRGDPAEVERVRQLAELGVDVSVKEDAGPPTAAENQDQWELERQLPLTHAANKAIAFAPESQNLRVAADLIREVSLDVKKGKAISTEKYQQIEQALEKTRPEPELVQLIREEMLSVLEPHRERSIDRSTGDVERSADQKTSPGFKLAPNAPVDAEQRTNPGIKLPPQTAQDATGQAISQQTPQEPVEDIYEVLKRAKAAREALPAPEQKQFDQVLTQRDVAQKEFDDAVRSEEGQSRDAGEVGAAPGTEPQVQADDRVGGVDSPAAGTGTAGQAPAAGEEVAQESPSKAQESILAPKDALKARAQHSLDANASLSDAERKHFAAEFERVVEVMPEAAIERLIDGDAPVQFHATPDDVAKVFIGYTQGGQLVNDGDKLLAQRMRTGSFTPFGFFHPKIGLVLDGKGGIGSGHTGDNYAHELAHVIDKGYLYSGSKAWEAIYKEEFLTLSKAEREWAYAKKSPAEAFCEFAASVYGVRSSADALRELFPKATAYWERNGLFPEGNTETLLKRPTNFVQPVVNKKSGLIGDLMNRLLGKGRKAEAAKPSEQPVHKAKELVEDKVRTDQELFDAAGLTEKERQAFLLRAVENKSFRTAAKDMNLSYERVRQLEQSARKKMGENRSVAKEWAERGLQTAKEQVIAGEAQQVLAGQVLEPTEGVPAVRVGEKVQELRDHAEKTLELIYAKYIKELNSGRLTPEREAEFERQIAGLNRQISGESPIRLRENRELRRESGGESEGAGEPEKAPEAVRPSPGPAQETGKPSAKKSGPVTPFEKEWRAKARKEVIPFEQVKERAEELRAQSEQEAESPDEIRKAVLDALGRKGYSRSKVAGAILRGADWLKGVDDVAAQINAKFGTEYSGDDLVELLGKPKPEVMTATEAYKQALDELVQAKQDEAEGYGGDARKDRPPDKDFTLFEMEPLREIGLKNRDIDAEREARGLPKADKIGYQAWGTAWEKASEIAENDPDQISNMIAEIDAAPRAVNDVEEAMIGHRIVELANEQDKALADYQAAEKAAKTGGAAEAGRLAVAEKAVQDVTLALQVAMDVNQAVGTQTARGLAFRKAVILETFDLAKMIQTATVANGGQALSAHAQAEIAQLRKELLDTQAAADKKIAALEAKVKAGQKPRKLGGAIKDAFDRLKSSGAAWFSAPSDVQMETTGDPAMDDAIAAARAMRKSGVNSLDAFLAQAELHLGTLTDEAKFNLTNAWEASAFKAVPSDADKARLAVAAVNRVADLYEKALQDGTAIPEKGKIRETVELEAARRRLDSLKRMYGEYSQAAAEKVLQQMRERVQKQIDALNRQIDAGAKDVKGEKQQVKDARLDALNEHKEALREHLDKITEPPKKTADQQRLEAAKTAVAQAVMDYNMRPEDFKTPKPAEIVPDQELKDLRFAAAKAKARWLNRVEKYRQANLNTAQKILWAYDETTSLLRGIKLGMDFAPAMRQGIMYTLGNMTKSFKTFVRTAPAMLSEARLHAIQDAVHMRPNALNGLYEKAGLGLENHEGLLEGERSWAARFFKRIPGLSNMARHGSAYLTTIRADWFDMLAADVGKDGKLTKAQARALGAGVNILTGKGDVYLGENATAKTAEEKISWVVANIFSRIFLAPSWVMSRFMTLTGKPMWFGDTATRAAFFKEYCKAVRGAATIGASIALAFWLLNGPDDELEIPANPLDSGFGRLNVDNGQKIDLWGGLAQLFPLVTHMMTNRQMKDGRMQKTQSGEIENWWRNKLGVIPGAVLNARDIITGDVKAGRQKNWLPSWEKPKLGIFPGSSGFFLDFVKPVPLSDLTDAYERQGFTKATFLSALTLIGNSLSTKR